MVQDVNVDIVLCGSQLDVSQPAPEGVYVACPRSWPVSLGHFCRMELGIMAPPSDSHFSRVLSSSVKLRSGQHTLVMCWGL